MVQSKQICLLLTIALIVLLIFDWMKTDEAARSGKMRRRKMRKDQMLRFLHSMKKEYYNNTNGAEIVKSSYFDNAFELGDKVSFLCIARGNPVPRVSWFKDGQEFVAHEFSRVAEYSTKEGLIKSKLEIDPARQIDAGTYECHANNIYSVDRRQFKADF